MSLPLESAFRRFTTDSHKVPENRLKAGLQRRQYMLPGEGRCQPMERLMSKLPPEPPRRSAWHPGHVTEPRSSTAIREHGSTGTDAGQFIFTVGTGRTAVELAGVDRWQQVAVALFDGFEGVRGNGLVRRPS